MSCDRYNGQGFPQWVVPLPHLGIGRVPESRVRSPGMQASANRLTFWSPQQKYTLMLSPSYRLHQGKKVSASNDVQ
ncbi:hypothetical protein E2C01_037821 [Portunus trituberculatus]|uniref:Uncharacterized protein n=1 Tax=Portunus trituberculatus TaxID=210409 RepID=A0A5B7FF50_PORTR|nr:hypothetical protein [Portunus trituberculatus]